MEPDNGCRKKNRVMYVHGMAVNVVDASVLLMMLSLLIAMIDRY